MKIQAGRCAKELFFNSWIVIKLTRFPWLNTAIRRVSVRGASHIRQKLCFCSGGQLSEKPPILAKSICQKLCFWYGRGLLERKLCFCSGGQPSEKPPILAKSICQKLCFWYGCGLFERKLCFCSGTAKRKDVGKPKDEIFLAGEQASGYGLW